MTIDKLEVLAKRWEDKNYPLFFALALSTKTRKKNPIEGGQKTSRYPYYGWYEAIEQCNKLGKMFAPLIERIFVHHSMVRIRRFKDLVEPKKFRDSNLLELIQAYDPDDKSEVLITQAGIRVERNDPYGDKSTGYVGVLRFNYGFLRDNFDNPIIRCDLRILEILRQVSRRFVLGDRLTSDPTGVILHYALLGERDNPERRKYDDKAWKRVYPDLKIPKVYATHRTF